MMARFVLAHVVWRGIFVIFSLSVANVANANANAVVAPEATLLSADLTSSIDEKAELLPIELALNGDKVIAQNLLRTPIGLALSEVNAKQARLQWRGEVFNHSGDSWVLLSQLLGAEQSYDAPAARVNLKVDTKDLAIQKVENLKPVMPVPTAVPALLTQYDWYGTSFSNSNDGLRTTAATASVEHIFSLGALRFNQSWAVSSSASDSPSDTSKLVRGESGVRFDDPSSATSWWLGDNFTSNQSWRRSYRLLGAGVQSNFAGRPDIQILPRPTLNGFLVEPSAYELFLNNKKIGKGQFDFGQFEFNNLPAVAGNGDVRVVFQDALGSQRIQTIPFYVSPRQLAAGLHDYQLNVGKLRTAFNGNAADYGDWVVAAEYGIGLSDSWTIRAATELAKDQSNIGFRQIFSLWGLGSLTLDTTTSSNNGKQGGYAALQSDWRNSGWNLTFSADKRSRDFWRVGDSITSSARRQAGYSASIGYGLGSFGSVGFAGAVESRFDGTRTKNISASYSKQLTERAHLNVTGNVYKGDSNSRSVFVMLSYNFDAFRPVRVLSSIQNANNIKSLSTSFTQDATTELPLGVSAGVSRDSVQNSSASLGLNWMSDVTAINVNANRSFNQVSGSQTQLFASGSGSVTVTSYGIFPSMRINDSAVLIDLAGSPQVRAHAGGRSVKTNDSGYALLPQAAGYVQNQAMFEPSDLPLEVGFSSQVAFVTPWPRSVGLAKFDVVNTAGESFRVLDKNDQPIKVGSEVLLAAENPFVGRDGYLYLTSRADGDEVTIKTPESTICTAKLPERKAGQARSEPVAVICE